MSRSHQQLAPLALIAALGGAGVAASQEADFSGVYNFVKISDQLSTSGQISLDDIDSVDSAGFDVVVNLAPARWERNFEEGFRVTQAGMTYIQIPVDWANPALRDLELFFDVMEANEDRDVFVHCFANMRVSVFVYLYRTLRKGVPDAEAWQDVLKVWDPAKQPRDPPVAPLHHRREGAVRKLGRSPVSAATRRRNPPRKAWTAG